MADFDPAIESFPTIKNRHGLGVFIKVLEVPGAKQNAYIAHGFSDVHDTPHMRALTTAFVANGYNVVLWDATHSWGRSEGEMERASFYHHHEDLEDVIEWSRGERWYRNRFVLAGHSMGGIAAGTYAVAHPREVAGLVLVNSVVSGTALRKRVPWPARLWWRLRGHVTLRERGTSRLGWELMRSGWSYNLLEVAHRLVMPVLIVAAEKDRLIPVRLARRLYGRLATRDKRLEVVEGARHAFDEPWEMERLREIVAGWLDEKVLR